MNQVETFEVTSSGALFNFEWFAKFSRGEGARDRIRTITNMGLLRTRTSTIQGSCLSALPKVAEQTWEEKKTSEAHTIQVESLLSPLTGPKVR